MPVLTIGDKEIKVGPEFLKLSPEEQQAAVDEIAKELGLSEGPETPIAESALRGAKQGFTGNFGDEAQGLAASSPIPGQNPNQTIPTLNAVDVIAGAAHRAAQAIAPGVFGTGAAERGDKVLAEQRAKDAQSAQDNPGTTIASGIAGALANPVFRVAPSGVKVGAATGAAQGAIMGAGQGEGTDRIWNAMTGGGIGGAGGALGGWIGSKMNPATPRPANPVVEAGQRQGVPVPNFLASDSRGVQMAAQAGRQSPFGGPKLEQAAQDFRTGVGQVADDAAKAIGSGNAVKAGEAATRGINDTIETIIPAQVSKLYQKVDSLIKPNVTTDLVATRKAAGEITAKRLASAMDESKAVAEVSKALQSKGLTYEGIKGLRTSIGEMIKGGKLPADVSEAELKRIYGALSDDLAAAVRNAGGPAAEQAWKRANQFKAASVARQQKLATIVGAKADASGERVFDRLAAMASSTARGDVRLLSQARRAMQPDEWREVASAVVQRLGRAAPDAEFSADRFITQWAKMSGDGKSLLFGNNAQLRQALDDIATLSAKMKQAEQFANRSNTGRVGVATAFGAGFMTNPVAAIAAALGSEVAARILARPATAASAAKWARIYAAAINKPTMTTAQALQRGSSQFGVSIARELGIPQAANDIGAKLLGASRSAASDEDR